MRHYAKLILSFFLGILLFLTLALCVNPLLAGGGSSERIEKEGIISKTAMTGYPKHLDSLYFMIGSAVIPFGALAFWNVVARWKSRVVLMLSAGWFAILLLMILKR